MAQSTTYKKGMNFAYGIGASIVIIGALFKIQHFNLDVFGLFNLSGGLMLSIGLIAEAIVFFISAFDTPEDDYSWEKVYPELADDSIALGTEPRGPEGLLSKKLDNLLQEANIDADLMENFGTSMKNFQGAADGLSTASETISFTNKYNEQMSLATGKMESLNNLYQVQMESASKQSELNNAVAENTERLKEQMESLAGNLSSLNGVYGGMLSAMTNK